MTSRANATFAYAVLFGSSRKSWKTQPIERRKFGMRHDRMLPTSRLFTMIFPLVGWISRSSNLTIVDLPEPDGPMKKTNSPFSIDTDTSLRDGRCALG